MVNKTEINALSTAEIIQFSNIAKQYGKNEFALNGVNFNLKRGKITALLGPNGAGKSTIMRIIATLSQPSAGMVQIMGLDPKTDYQTIRKNIAYIAQQTSIDNFASVLENMLFQAALYHLPKHESIKRIDQLLALFKLNEHKNIAAMKLSGGMQRRLDIAMALIHNPKILLMDEPSANLDPESRMQLWSAIENSQKENELTVLFSTHYLEEAEEHAEHILFIDHGKLIAEGTVDDLKNKVGGETIVITFINKNMAANAAIALEKSFAKENTIVIENRLLIATDEASRKTSDINKILDENNLRSLSITISKPSLNELYMILTGETFEEAHLKASKILENKQRGAW